MATPIPCKEQLTTAAAAAVVLSVGVVSAMPSTGAHSLLVLSAICFAVLYATG